MNDLTVPHRNRSFTVRSRTRSHVTDVTRIQARPLSGAAWARSYRRRLMWTDTAIIVIAVALDFGARLLFEPKLEAEPTSLASMALGGALVIGMWAIAMIIFRSRDAHVIGVGPEEYKRVLSASITFFGILAILFVVAGTSSARWFFVSTAPVGLVSLLLSRWLWRKWLFRQRALGHSLSRVVVVGKRKDVIKVVGQIDRSLRAAYLVVAAVIGKTDGKSEKSEGGALRGVTVLRGTDRVVDFATKLDCDGIIVAGDPGGKSDYIRDLAWELEGKSLELVLATSLANVAGPRIHYRPVDGLPLLNVEIPEYEGGKHVLKRVLDIVLAAIALIVLSPVFAVVALMVRADSPGPALFSQERVGRGGRMFRIYKFRSMTVDAPQRLAELREQNEGNGLLFKLKDDPRVTKLGRALRKYSIDELPQIWNVLVGDMSLVGPRPPLANEVEEYEDHVRRRLYIKPGLTGMWQIGGRSALSWEESVALDLYYVENWSVVGDLMIIWRTFRVLVSPVGSY
jgi:exopolysaccharide biosynthesis polyprenyl glycosylphosphotransferase